MAKSVCTQAPLFTKHPCHSRCTFSWCIAWIAFLIASAMPIPPLAQKPVPVRQIAITFDDFPFVNEGLSLTDIKKKKRALLKTLQKHRVKAIGFVNEDKLYIKQSEVNSRIGILEAW